MTIVFFLDIYYCIIIAWTLFYLLATIFSIPNLPWSNCGKKNPGELYPDLDNLRKYVEQRKMLRRGARGRFRRSARQQQQISSGRILGVRQAVA